MAFIVILLFPCITLKSQNNFTLLISTDQYEKFGDAVEDENGNYFFAGYRTELYSPEDHGYLIKVNSNGDILKENTYALLDSAIVFHRIIILNDSLIVIGLKGSVEIGHNDILTCMILDTNLNLIRYSSNSILPDYYMAGINSLISTSGHIVLTGIAIRKDNLDDEDIFLYEMTRDLDSIRCAVDQREYIQIGMELLEDPRNNFYKVFGHGYYPGTIPGYDELITFDPDFNFVSVDTIAWQLYSQHTAVWLDDSTYLLTGHKVLPNPTKRDIGIAKLTRDDELLNAKHFGKDGDTVTYAGVNNNVDFVTRDNIYFGGTTNFIVNQWPWQTDPSWIILINLDSNLNVNWQRFYGGDAFYHLYGLLATQDGGCLMYAERYDANIQFEEYDVYILKVDTNGLLTSVYDIPNVAPDELAIYPNPATDQITAQFPGVSNIHQKTLEIYNSLGESVKSIFLQDKQDRQRVNVSDLPVGIYYVSLLSQAKRLATGKFVIVR